MLGIIFLSAVSSSEGGTSRGSIGLSEVQAEEGAAWRAN
jgi:hypothetical protein